MKLPSVPSEGFLQALPASERKKLGKAGISKAEALETFERGQERELQRLIANWLNLHGIYYVQSRMDKRTSNKCGTPDFLICAHGMFLALEAKVESQTLTKEQAAEFARIRKSGGKAAICFCLQDAIEALRDMKAT